MKRPFNTQPIRQMKAQNADFTAKLEELKLKLQKQFDLGYDCAYAAIRTDKGLEFYRMFAEESQPKRVPFNGY